MNIQKGTKKVNIPRKSILSEMRKENIRKMSIRRVMRMANIRMKKTKMSGSRHSPEDTVKSEIMI